jgi:hypothetical protein
VEHVGVTERDVFLALGGRHDITGIVHLAAAGLSVDCRSPTRSSSCASTRPAC